MRKKEENIETVTDDAIYNYIIQGADMGKQPLGYEKLLRLTLVELVKTGKADFLFLREPELLKVWNSWVTLTRKKVDILKEDERKYREALAAYESLSQDKRELLKIRKPRCPKFVLED